MIEPGPKGVILVIEADTMPRLAHLAAEAGAIEAALAGHPTCEVVRLRPANLDDLADRLDEPGLVDRLCVVHYAGHADGEGIRLPGGGADRPGETAFMRGIAALLRPMSHLRLLFLNGCSTEAQALDLLRSGVPMVIATRSRVADARAVGVATRFYESLARGASVAEAMDFARGVDSAAGLDRPRDVIRPDGPRDAMVADPWDIYGPRYDRGWRLAEPFYRGNGPRWDPGEHPYRASSPYLGLKYFEEADRGRFFGRDRSIADLAAAVEANPMTLVVGASGSGKSSVVRAGLIPLWRDRAASNPMAFIVTPGEDPIGRLRHEITRVARLDTESARTIDAESLAQLSDGDPWILVVDQFEQVFTRTTDEAARSRFLETLVGLAGRVPANIRVVLVMRDDFFPQLRDHPSLFALTDRNLHRVAKLDRDALREAIERPAALHGVGFAPGLVDEIVEDVEGQPGDLPLLQYTLDSLWRRKGADDRLLRLASYRDLGGVRGALRDRFEALYREGDDARKKVFRAAMLRLVSYRGHVDGPRVVSRLAPEREFRGEEAALVGRLRDVERLLTSGSGSTRPGSSSATRRSSKPGPSTAPGSTPTARSTRSASGSPTRRKPGLAWGVPNFFAGRRGNCGRGHNWRGRSNSAAKADSMRLVDSGWLKSPFWTQASDWPDNS